MFLIDFIIDWMYEGYYFIRDHLMPVIFIVLVLALLIQGSMVFHLFNSAPAPVTDASTITISHPPFIQLNKPFTITMSNLHAHTNYAIQLYNRDYFFDTYESFQANNSIYSTQLQITSTYNINNTLKLAVYNPAQYRIEGLVLIPIVGI